VLAISVCPAAVQVPVTVAAPPIVVVVGETVSVVLPVPQTREAVMPFRVKVTVDADEQ